MIKWLSIKLVQLALGFILMILVLAILGGILKYHDRSDRIKMAVEANDITTVESIAISPSDASNGLFYAQSGDMTRLLLGRGANQLVRNDFGCTPLHFATGAGLLDVVNALLESGADPNAVDTLGNTPLHWAIEPLTVDAGFTLPPNVPASNRRKVIDQLLSHGGDVNARNNIGRTPLFLAARCTGELVSVLVAAGADVSARDAVGRTPLHEAVAADQVANAKLLLENGADPSAKDDWEHKSPTDIIRGMDSEMVELFAHAANSPTRFRPSKRADQIR